ncbi:MAG: hypothetical protein EU529_05010 [Promethearchaeota archaeon]|nr:MAG: hypothetical protein EU529_05010 [Candidatus Lokiarchaeota archaeon]
MAFDVEKEIKIWWITGIIVLLVYGVWLYISPESYRALLGSHRYFDPVSSRIIGGIYIAWAIIGIRIFKKLDNWEKIEEWMYFGVMVQILILIAEIIGIVMYGIFGVGVIIVIIINIFFTILGIHIIMQKRE